jgi:hypothetical protein
MEPDSPGTIGCTEIPPHQKNPLDFFGDTLIDVVAPGSHTSILYDVMHRVD